MQENISIDVNAISSALLSFLYVLLKVKSGLGDVDIEVPRFQKRPYDGMPYFVHHRFNHFASLSALIKLNCWCGSWEDLEAYVVKPGLLFENSAMIALRLFPKAKV